MIDATRGALDAAAPADADAVRAAPPLVRFSAAMRADSRASSSASCFATCTAIRRWRRPPSRRRRWCASCSTPTWRGPARDAGRASPARRSAARAVADYIAGMTDRFALREHERLTGRRLRGSLSACADRRFRSPHWPSLGGVAAALHIGKLPPAVPALQASLGIGLVQAGFLLSLVQVAGMALGLAVGLDGGRLGLRRSMLAGLAMLAVASALGGWRASTPASAAWRCARCEGVGFLLAVMPGPGLIRRLVAPGADKAAIGLWGAYMPLGAARGAAGRAGADRPAGWPGWWWLLAALSAGMAACACVAPCRPTARTPRRRPRGWRRACAAPACAPVPGCWHWPSPSTPASGSP